METHLDAEPTLFKPSLRGYNPPKIEDTTITRTKTLLTEDEQQLFCTLLNQTRIRLEGVVTKITTNSTSREPYTPEEIEKYYKETDSIITTTQESVAKRMNKIRKELYEKTRDSIVHKALFVGKEGFLDYKHGITYRLGETNQCITTQAKGITKTEEIKTRLDWEDPLLAELIRFSEEAAVTKEIVHALGEALAVINSNPFNQTERLKADANKLYHWLFLTVNQLRRQIADLEKPIAARKAVLDEEIRELSDKIARYKVKKADTTAEDQQLTKLQLNLELLDLYANEGSNRLNKDKVLQKNLDLIQTTFDCKKPLVDKSTPKIEPKDFPVFTKFQENLKKLQDSTVELKERIRIQNLWLDRLPSLEQKAALYQEAHTEFTALSEDFARLSGTYESKDKELNGRIIELVRFQSELEEKKGLIDSKFEELRQLAHPQEPGLIYKAASVTTAALGSVLSYTVTGLISSTEAAMEFAFSLTSSGFTPQRQDDESDD